MPWQVEFSSKAEKYYARLSARTRERVKNELEDLSHLDNLFEHQSVKRLTGELRGFCRLRVGKYRIIFSILEESHAIAVVNIAPRGDVYK